MFWVTLHQNIHIYFYPILLPQIVHDFLLKYIQNEDLTYPPEASNLQTIKLLSSQSRFLLP